MQQTIHLCGDEYTHLIIDRMTGRVDGIARDFEEITDMLCARMFFFDSEQSEQFDWIQRGVYGDFEFLPVSAASAEAIDEAEHRIEQLVTFALV